MSNLIFFDIDGTLWDEQMNIPKSTIETLRRLQQNGHKIFLCSGRARSNINSDKLLALGFDGILAGCGTHVELDGRVIFEKLIPDDEVKRLVELLLELQMPAVLEGPEYHWIDVDGFERDNYIAYLFETMGEKAIPFHAYMEEMRINKFSAAIYPKTDYKRIKEILQADYDFLEHNPEVVEVVPKGYSKATGIAWLCDYLKVPVENTYAIGDSVNDLDMLRYAGHSIAMGNGMDVAKEAAEYVTTDIHADGIRNAMEHYHLI